ncbi:pyridine nucleotide-disulfide oxidoreductase [Paramagnetospirillum marisnigri]|uniref:Pyridine nucleotide-disulfide oxidoreductase n=1 Tax=Paramagnetospirillum marisnigri TaxID=1285242 RepID=A0A178MY24_9PROT|nr:FAD-dependent oxidoreductase [Paramagnetospirillum marisnigri]OAN54573.1 pyridine nucleotide-disulfide oxidoreductase [Paramagnetospirillum marisnigri]
MHHVIIGAGPAGVTAAETLRREAPADNVTLICGEPGPPYSRMAIPYALAGKIGEDGTRLRQRDGHFESLGIAVRHDRVTAIDAAAHRLTLAEGGSLAYDRLLIATGSSPARPSIPGLDLPGVHACWTLEDMRKVTAQLRPGTRVLLLGAGFVSCIILQSLVQRGAVVTVSCGSSGRMVRSMMDETAGGLIMAWCRAKGVTVLTGGRPSAITSAASGLLTTLDSGLTAESDLIIVGTGVKTNTGFLAGSGIELDEGILVDGWLQSSLPDIYAAGDVAQGLNLCTGAREVHAIQPTAVEHGRVAALNMAGKPTPFGGSLSMNTLDTLGLISCSFGLWMGKEGGEQVRLLDAGRFRYLRLELFDGRLVGANTVGMTNEIGVIRGLIQTRIRLGGWLERLKRDPSRLAEAYVACAQGLAAE